MPFLPTSIRRNRTSLARRLRSACSATLCCLSLAGAGSLHAAQVPPPAPLPDPTAMMVVIIPDLKLALTRIEELAEIIAPGRLPTGQLAAALGGPLSDPQLGLLGEGPITAIASPGMPVPSWAVVVPTSDSAKFSAIINLLGKQMPQPLQATPAGDLVIISMDPLGLGLGENLAKKYPELTAAKIPSDLRVLVAGEPLAGLTPLMAMGIRNQQRTTPPQQQAQFKIGLAMIVALGEIIRDAPSHQFDLSLSKDGVRSDHICAAKPGSVLAKSLVAPTAKPIGLAGKLGATPAGMTMTGIYPTGISTWIADLLTRVKKHPDGSIVSQEVIDVNTAAADCFTGEIAVRMSPDGVGMGASAMIAGTKGSSARELMLLGQKAMTTGALADFYKSMGAGSEYIANVRTSGGFPVDTQITILDPTKIPGLPVGSAKTITEYAFAPNYLVSSQMPAMLDAAIAAPLSAMATRAEVVHGKDHDLFADIDIGQIVESMAANNPMIGMFAAGMPKGHLITATGDVATGRLRIQSQIPTALMKAFADLAAAGGRPAPPQPGTNF